VSTFFLFVLIKKFQVHQATLFKDPPPLQGSRDYSWFLSSVWKRK